MGGPKVYVAVQVEFLADGRMRPQAITWEDGRRYEIDRVTEIRQAAAGAGGLGERYTVSINGRQSYLFFERGPRLGGGAGRWFVERRSA